VVSNLTSNCNIALNLVVGNVEQAAQFYERVLGAQTLFRGTQRDGFLPYVQLRIGNSVMIVSDERIYGRDVPTASNDKSGDANAMFEVFVDDVDAALDRAQSGW
jgi:uncharacterized glyoxalase superfamily protein PhnB